MRTALIADDLTGAADAGVQLVRAGYRTGVAFWDAPLPPAGDLDAVVADTDSRALAAVDAAARVASVARTLKRTPLMFKKIDSTLRGAIGAEVGAARDGSERTRLVVAPAFPAAGRTTRGGVQCMNGRPVDAPQADVPRLLDAAGFADVAVLDRGELVDAQRVAAAMRGHACVVADAEDDADLAALVRGVPDPDEVLWVGSAGLAAALGAVHPGPHEFAGTAPARPSADGVLVAIGSASPTARAQVTRLAEAAGVEDVPLSLDLLAGGHEDEAVRVAVTTAARALAASRCAVVHTTSDARGDEISRRIPGTLAAVVARLAGEGNVQALVLSGGETAIHAARALGAGGLLIEDELEPGVPMSRLIGPRPYPVVTKAGGFGGPMTLVNAVEALGGRVGT